MWDKHFYKLWHIYELNLFSQVREMDFYEDMTSQSWYSKVDFTPNLTSRIQVDFLQLFQNFLFCLKLAIICFVLTFELE